MPTELEAHPPIHPASFDKLDPSRFDQVYLYHDGSWRNDGAKQQYRYRLTVVDRSVLPTSSYGIQYATVVFLIPAGRESEYLFSSQKGLSSVVAKSAQCVRLIAVAFGRHATFSDQESVQTELTAAVQVLSRQSKFLPSFLKRKLANTSTSIPFMATDGIGSRNVLVTGTTDLSGDYLVEQARVKSRTLRRLYFMDNPFVIQSEVTLQHHCSSDNDDKSDGDDSKSRTESVDKSRLSFEYHKAIVTGIILLATSIHPKESENPTGCIIGLGGGGLVMFLNHVLPWLKLTAVELDPSIVAIAKAYFGLETTETRESGCRVVIGNGLHVGAALTGELSGQSENRSSGLGFPPASLSFVVVDVDSKDKTVGMSCPPVEFGTVQYLQQLKDVLKPTGSVLAINISARDPEQSKTILHNAQEVFGSVFVSAENDGDDDGAIDETKAVNFSLLATPDKVALSRASDELLSRLEETISKERVHEEVWEDIRSCEFREWVNKIDDNLETKTALAGHTSSSNTTNTKNNNRTKKKGNKKGKKR
jgi:hypothetical protein